MFANKRYRERLLQSPKKKAKPCAVGGLERKKKKKKVFAALVGVSYYANSRACIVAEYNLRFVSNTSDLPATIYVPELFGSIFCRLTKYTGLYEGVHRILCFLF